jgi:hypothetical protein
MGWRSRDSFHGQHKTVRDVVDAKTFTLPITVLGYTAGKKLDACISSLSYPVASFSFSCNTVTSENQCQWWKSSRCMAQAQLLITEILKLVVVASGVNILAA